MGPYSPYEYALTGTLTTTGLWKRNFLSMRLARISNIETFVNTVKNCEKYGCLYCFVFPCRYNPRMIAHTMKYNKNMNYYYYYYYVTVRLASQKIRFKPQHVLFNNIKNKDKIAKTANLSSAGSL